MHDRNRTLGAVPALLTAGALLTGCGVSDLESGTRSAAAEPDEETTCMAGDFGVEIDLPAPRAEFGVLKLTNTSSQHCEVEGWTGLTMLEEAGTPEQVPFKQVNHPDPGRPIHLVPGESAYSGVRFIHAARDAEDAYEITGMVAIPPDTNTSTPVRLTGAGGQVPLVIRSIEMGTLQANRTTIHPW